MKYNVFTYLVGEGFSNIFKNKKQAFTSFGTMCLIMIFFGFCFMIIGNFNHFIKQVETQQGIQAFIKKDATEEEIEEVKNQINEIEEINTIDFVSQEQALQSVKERVFQERADLLEGYDVSIFKPSYKITLTDITKTSEVKEKLSQIDNIVKVTNTDDVIEVLIKVARGIKIGSYIIIIALIAVSIFIISNTIKLTVYARRKEISIMKYVGATNNFIRWPFMVEGVILGLSSGIFSLIIVSSLYMIVSRNITLVNFLANLNLRLLEFNEMFNFIVIVYLVLGMGIGVLGSTKSMRKYLKV